MHPERSDGGQLGLKTKLLAQVGQSRCENQMGGDIAATSPIAHVNGSCQVHDLAAGHVHCVSRN